ncbi:hypothetical protein V4F39_22470 [Aquincola sp. MAHUQ-54]|uniref:O-antigen ligase n=1 Tax=Aquincola agrisoli TaxID=3119538 RepID=A0AAW9QC56_9BURK
MNLLSLGLAGVGAIALWTLPRTFAALPLLLAAVYTTTGVAIEIGPANFSVLRLLVAVGVLRVLVRGESMAGGVGTTDRLMLAWAAWLVGSAVFHEPGTWIYRAGIVWSDLGCYVLLRVFVRDAQELLRLFGAACAALLPVSLLMLVETHTGENAFSVLGGVNPMAAMRDGQLRASGPFAHPILAGTVGAACVPMAIALWRQRRGLALLGFFDAAAMLYASHSSGPVLMAGFIVLALCFWPLRWHMREVRLALVAAGIALQGVMNDPFYFVLARVDIAGGSRGWHRAQLIRSALEHLDEWWLVGTDYTRHWMASGIYANRQHTDITNHVLAMGVMGGLLLMLLFVAVLASAFRDVGRVVHANGGAPDTVPGQAPDTAAGDGDNGARAAAPLPPDRLAWLLGATLFGHLLNFMSVSVFDQSVFFVYLTLAGIAALVLHQGQAAAEEDTLPGHWHSRGMVRS